MLNFRPSWFLPCMLKSIARKHKMYMFHWVKMPSKFGKSTNRGQNLFSSGGGQDTPACQISGNCWKSSADNARKPEIWPASLSKKNVAKIRKIKRPWLKSNQFWRLLGYIIMPNFRPFLPCVLITPGNSNSTCFTKFFGPCYLAIWQMTLKNVVSSRKMNVFSVFLSGQKSVTDRHINIQTVKRTDRHTDGQRHGVFIEKKPPSKKNGGNHFQFYTQCH